MKQTQKLAIGAFAIIGVVSSGMMLSGRALAQTHNQDSITVQNQQKEKEEQNEQEEGKEGLNLLKAPIKIDAAAKAALAAKAGYVNEAKLEEEGGKLLWDIDVVTPDNKVWGVDVDAKTGKVVLAEEENGDGD
jgi:uncharacterized membrane protein YkoI